MSQVIFKDPIVSVAPVRTGTGTGSVSIDRLTHFTVAQDYTLTCIAKAPDCLFSVAGSLDGPVGIAVVGTQFIDQDLKIFLTISQGPTVFEIGDQFVFTVANGTDLNQANIDTYDELPQKNFKAGLRGVERGDSNVRYSDAAIAASKFIQGLKFVANVAGAAGNAISIEYLNTVAAIAAQLIEQDLTYLAVTPGVAGNSITLSYIEWTPAQAARITIQNLQYQAVAAGTAGNSITVAYTTGATAGAEIVSVIGNAITVQIQSGVSTATQIASKVAAFPAAAALVTTSFKPDGTHSGDVQTAPVSPTSLAGGSNSIGAAGSEVVSVTGSAITVTMQGGVSTATQIKAAIDASSPAHALVSVTVSGTGSTAQTSFVGTHAFTLGANQVGGAGAESVVVTSNAIQVFLESGKSTATQIKTAIDASSPAHALVTVSIITEGSAVQYSPRTAEFLTGGKAKYFAFNHDEFSDAGSFAEGNASVHMQDLQADGKTLLGGHVHLTDVLSLNDANTPDGSGHPIGNVQKIINNLFALRKLQLDFASDGTFRWSGTQLSFTQNLEIWMRDTGIRNRILVAQSPISIADGESLYVNLFAPANSDLTAATGSTIPDTFPAFRICTRIGSKLYWHNNVISYANDVGRMGEGGNLRQQIMTVITEGGTVSVPSIGGSIAWSAPIKIKALGSSAVISIAASSISMADDDVAYVDLDDPMATATRTLTVVPRSQADLTRLDRLWVFHRSSNRIYVRNGTNVQPGEETTIGDSLSDDTITYIGATSRTDNAPSYTTANGGPTANVHIADGDNLTKAAKKTDAALGAHEALTSGVHGVTGNVVGTTDTQTLSNKSLVDSNTSIVDVSDPTKKIMFDAGGTPATKTTIAAAQTADRIVSLPDATDTLVGKQTSDVLKNKKLEDSTTQIVDQADNTKALAFDVGGTTGTKTTVQTAQTVDRTWALPDASSTAVGTDVAQTLTKKTFDDELTMKEIATPGVNPSAGYGKFYRKSDGNLYVLNSAGVETQVGTGAGGSGSGSGGGALTSLIYRAEFTDGFDTAIDDALNTAAGFTDASLYNATGKLYRLNYDASRTVTAVGTAYTISVAPTFTVKAGDVIVVGTIVRKISAISSQTVGTLEAAFPTNPTGAACCVSQTVHTVDLNNYAGDGLAVSAGITTTIDSVLVDYDDTASSGDAILDVGTPNIAVVASDDNSTWTSLFTRPGDLTTSITPQGFTTAATSLYLRFFANKTSGTGAVNVLGYKAYFHTQTAVVNGNLAAQAYGWTDNSSAGVNCTITPVLNGKTRITLTNGVNYVQGVNPNTANGQLDVYVNGAKLPRYVSAALTPDGSYTEVSGTVIDLDSDYSGYTWSIEVIKRIGVVDTSSSNTSRILTLEQKPIGINYISAADAESTTTGWNRYQDASAATPADGTGGSPNASFTFGTTSTLPLRGSNSFLLSKDAANRQGEGLSYDFLIDRADMAKVLTLTMDYEASANFVFGASSDLQVYLYDVTNAQVIQPSGFTIDGTKKQRTTFQTASNSQSYRLIFHCATTNALAWTFKFDNVKISPEVTLQGVPVSDWTAYTPSTQGFGTITAVSAFWRRVGDTLEVQGVFTAGGTTAVPPTIGLPSGLSVGSPITASGNQIVGIMGVQSNTANNVFSLIVNQTSTVMSIGLFTTAGNNPVTVQTSNTNLANSVEYNFHARGIPIAGWSSNVAMSTDTDTRVVGARVILSANQSIASNTITTIAFDTKVYDTHGAISGLGTTSFLYTIPVAGKYRVTTSFFTAVVTWAAGQATDTYIYKNGAIYSLSTDSAWAATGQNLQTRHADTVDCVAGDTIQIRFDQNHGSSINVNGAADGRAYMAIERISGPATIAATEKICASYNSSASTATQNAFSVPVCTVKTVDTHGAYNTSTGTFTCPAPGLYRVTGSAASFAGQVPASAALRTAYGLAQKNGAITQYGPVLVQSLQNSVSVAGNAIVNAIFQCVAGDTLQFLCFQNLGVSGAYANTAETHVEFERIG